jgi:hypothetical protein
MVTQNKDVLYGILNGTVCKCRKLVLKPGIEIKKIQMFNYWINTIGMDNMEYIEVEWEDCNHFVGKFLLKPETATFKVKYPILSSGNSCVQAQIELKYLPIIVNHAKTGHKLQGKTVKLLVIAEWSKVKNCAYIVLSRFKTLEGLFLMKPIPEDIDILQPKEYLDMMENIRRTLLATPEQGSELKESLNCDSFLN